MNVGLPNKALMHRVKNMFIKNVEMFKAFCYCIVLFQIRYSYQVYHSKLSYYLGVTAFAVRSTMQLLRYETCKTQNTTGYMQNNFLTIPYYFHCKSIDIKRVRDKWPDCPLIMEPLHIFFFSFFFFIF